LSSRRLLVEIYALTVTDKSWKNGKVESYFRKVISEKIKIFDETVQTKTKILDVMLSLGDTLIEAVRVLVIL